MTGPPHASGDILALWQNPPAAYRGKPFWSWNGWLEKDELLRQARVFADMGVGGFFMHSHTGLVIGYLGDEWFDLINARSDEARKLGLEAWLHDEDRWPSGSAGGHADRGEHGLDRRFPPAHNTFAPLHELPEEQAA